MRQIAIMAICGLALLAGAWRGAFDDAYFAQQAASGKVVFYGISEDQYWTNTFGVTQILVKAWGAGGWGGENGQYSSKGYGGGGGFAQGYVSVTNNEVLTIIVGDGGLGFLADTTHEDFPPNYGGGGGITRDGIYDRMVNFGGGRSAVRRASGGDIITGGGGGSGAIATTTNTMDRGAAGGGTNGLTGTGEGAGGGGTQLAGGAGGTGTTPGYPGAQYTGGNGITYFGGGGGGYYGGGGGGYEGNKHGSGGGGSAYIGGVSGGIMIAGGPDWIPAKTNDVDYIPPYAEGGYPDSPTDNGKAGLVVISWP